MQKCRNITGFSISKANICCFHFLYIYVFCDSKLNITGFWTVSQKKTQFEYVSLDLIDIFTSLTF